MYPLKHVFRNWKLFAALLIGVTLAATFCAAIGVKSNLAAEQALDKQISGITTDMSFTANLNRTNLPLAYNDLTSVEGVKSVDMLTSFNYMVRTSSDNYSTSYWSYMYSFPNSSRINDEWLNKPLDGIPTNYTYIVAGSNLAQKLKVGDNITMMVSFDTPKYYNTTSFYVNLTVAGFAELTDKGYSFLTNNNGGIIYYGNGGVSSVSSVAPTSLIYGGTYGYRGDSMIVGWDSTLQNLWSKALESSTAQITFNIDVDRQSLISPWNMEASIANLNVVEQRIQNQVLSHYLEHGSIRDMLRDSLYGYQYSFNSMLTSFIVVSIPVFFVAWYLGSTVSDVSFNIRRREIGLLSTKGLSSGQIQRMFLTEAVVIGAIGGALGVVGGLILNQYYAGTVDLSNLFASRMFDPTLAVVTIVFGIVLALLSVFLSSRKASRIPAVEALREYMPIETKSRFRWVAWVALILGSFQIAVLLSGVNVQLAIDQWRYASGNVIGVALSVFWSGFNFVMTFLAPFLFFWGFTKIVVRDSSKFQAAASKISSVMGDLGALAAKNVRRNPARMAAIAFLIALIIGFSVQVTGQIASQQDYIVRTVHSNVGADITVNEANATKGQLVFDDILGNVTGISNATIERTLWVPISGSYTTIQIRTIDPNTWAKSAYYEQDWFTGNTVDEMMRQMKGNNATIILDRSIAKQLNLKLWDEIGVDFNSCPRTLKIVGFFGPEPSDNNNSPMPIYRSGGFDSTDYINAMYYSYVPTDLFNMTYYSPIYNLEQFSTTYRIKLDPGVNGTEVANQIRQIAPTEITYVDSFDYQWRQSQANNNLYTYSSLQVLDIQNLGLVFAVLSASVGMALIAVVSLKERSREATLMSVRGLSYRQLVWMFLAENMAIITFSVILGIVVGTILVYGSVVSANNTLYMNQLVMQRLVFPADVVGTIGLYIALIYAATIGAILVMSSQYVTKLEKMVRAR
jgi:ABC-type lipoprotein release transport system permease subunit